MAILPLLQKLSFHVPGLSEKKRKNMERRLAFHEWTKGFRRFFRRPFVFLFGSPFHSNLGDQAQTECIIAWIRKNLPRHEIFIGTIYFSLVSVVLAASPANLLPNISVSSNAIFQQDYST